MGISTGVKGTVFMGYTDTPITFTDEPLTIVTGRAKAYITASTKRAWDPDTPITLTYTGGTYTGTAVICAGGVVRFTPALGAGITVTASGKYIPVSAVRTARSLNVDVEVTEEDSTVIPDEASTDAGWARNAPISRNLSGSVEMLMDDTLGSTARNAVIGNPDDGEGGSVEPGKVLFIEWGVTGSFAMYMLVWPGLSITANANALNTETINYTNCGVPPGIV